MNVKENNTHAEFHECWVEERKIFMGEARSHALLSITKSDLAGSVGFRCTQWLTGEVLMVFDSTDAKGDRTPSSL
ncbi:MAG: hypothetical protein LH647_17915 [Leptolyngbyaceae cyanobacterium CAN_BIN12]|nr:hypothetical protein [Leptolyngbyaceae cyanobacterium CAN_BIN12]